MRAAGVDAPADAALGVRVGRVRIYLAADHAFHVAAIRIYACADRALGVPAVGVDCPAERALGVAME